jgi:hypothetical protein
MDYIAVVAAFAVFGSYMVWAYFQIRRALRLAEHIHQIAAANVRAQLHDFEELADG